MNILTFRIIAIAGIILSGIGGSLLPARFASSTRRERIFSLGSAFAGGVFLGTGLLHVFPSAVEGLELFSVRHDFPWVSFLCACGFLLVMFIEKVLVYGRDEIAVSRMRHPGHSLAPYMLTLAFSIHSIIIGIALGTEMIIADAWIILVAILVYKWPAAFALEVSLHRAGVPKIQSMKIISFFCLMTPFGILLGSMLTAFLTGRVEQTVTSVFDALASGTFLYVALMGILQKEFTQPGNRLSKFMLMVFGLGIMVALAIWI